MTMGFEDDGDPPTGQATGSVDDARVGMDLEETTEEVVGKSVEKSGRRTSTSRLAHTSTTTTTPTMVLDKYKYNDNAHEDGQPTGVDVARIGMDLEKSASVAGQSVKKSGSTFLQKEIVEILTSTRPAHQHSVPILTH
jgi:hypothetical protein